MTAVVKSTYTATATTANPTVSVSATPAAGDVLVLLMANTAAVAATAVSGCGATWTRITGSLSFNNVLEAWIGVGATTSGTVTATATAAPAGRALSLHMVAGVKPTAIGVTASGTGARATPSQMAGNGQAVFGYSYSDDAASTVTDQTPATGWTEQSLSMPGAWMGTLHREPTGAPEAHTFTAQRPSGTTYVAQVVVGEAPRGNLLTNPSFETGTTGWMAFSGVAGSAIAVDTTTSYKGAQSLKVTHAPSGSSSNALFGLTSTYTSNADSIPVSVGLSYTLSGYVKANTGSTALRPRLIWLNSSGTYLSDAFPAVQTTTTSTWQRISHTAIAPSGAVKLGLDFNSGTPSGGSFFLDAVLLEQSAVLGEYFDGSTIAAGKRYAWAGTAHASTSTETIDRTNLMPYPSAETTLGWVAKANTSVISDALHYVGTKGAFFQRSSGTGPIAAGFGSTVSDDPNSDSIPVVAGETYTFSAYVYGWTNLPTVEALLIFQTATAYQSYAAGASVVTTGAWQRVSVTATVPAGAVKMGVVLRTAGAFVPVDTAFVADAFLIEKAPSVGPYFDGSNAPAGYDVAWTGTANASTSISSSVPPAGTTRTNLMPYPSAESGTNTFTTPVGGTDSSVSSAEAYVGTKSYRLYVSSGGSPLYAHYGASGTSTPNAYAFSCTAGETFTLSAYMKTLGGNPDMRAELIWMTDTAYLSTSSGTASMLFSSWKRYSVSATAPAGATKFALRFSSASSQAFGTLIHLDAILLEKSATLGGYFDGSTAAAGGKTYAWTGTANASTSTEFTPAGATAINTSYSGSGALSTTLTGLIDINSGFSGSGALTTRLSDYLNIDSGFSGSGSLATTLTGYQRISSSFSGTGTLGTSLSNYQDINSQFSGSGTLGTSLQLAAKLIDSDYGSEGVLLADLLYTVTPPPLEQSPLGKLVGYSVFNSAVPLNPEEGSGSAPSVSSSYTKGVDPEFMLGEELELTNPAIGSYTGEVVRVDVTEGSGVVGLSVDTLLGLTNKDLHLAPIIDSDQRWTAARAIDYWTQQAGVFYDAVPGDCAYYASGFGHTNAFTTGNPQRFYDKIYGAADTVLLNGRSVRTFGTDTLSVGAMYNALDTRVPVMLPFGKKMLLSAGIAVRGTGRTASVLWSLESSTGLPHVVDLTVTSAGAVTAKLGNTVLTTATVPANGEYRFTLSIERASRTAVATKLTVHTDDLNGSGTMLAEGMLRAHSYTLPGVLQLRSMHHKSDGGSGDQMLRWGTYLSVAAAHPKGLPAVQKALSQTTRDYPFISGFQGNVWKMLNEFCSIARLDVQFKDRRIHVAPRQSSVVAGAKFSRLTKTAERREKFKQVAVTNHQSKAVTNDQGVLWRADSVYQLNVREVFETTVQTPHSILSVVNPVPVPGITPFPYTAGGGQYVVTGADGYIIAPKWWTDNGGKVEVSLTEKEGEISLKITAPDVDSVRAPYRISEGAADRPALYISGSGVINDPKEVHINTGATHARQGFDSVFTSPFVTSAREVFDVAVRMAHEYSSAVADVQYDLPADFGVPTLFGQYPAGALFTDGERNFRIMEASQTSSQVSGRAVPYTTLGEYKKTYPAGATIADEKARHRGRTIRQFNIKPLRST